MSLKICEVVDELKSNIEGVNPDYDNAEEVLGKYYDSFKSVLETLLPRSEFAMYDDGTGYSVAIFDNADRRQKWLDEYEGLFPSCKPISSKDFFEVAGTNWDDPELYRICENVLCFTAY